MFSLKTCKVYCQGNMKGGASGTAICEDIKRYAKFSRKSHMRKKFSG